MKALMDQICRACQYTLCFMQMISSRSLSHSQDYNSTHTPLMSSVFGGGLLWILEKLMLWCFVHLDLSRGGRFLNWGRGQGHQYIFVWGLLLLAHVVTFSCRLLETDSLEAMLQRQCLQAHFRIHVWKSGMLICLLHLRFSQLMGTEYLSTHKGVTF